MDIIRQPHVRLDRIGDLRVDGGRYLSAGSGIASVGDRVYVVPDDDLYVGCFAEKLDEPGRAVPIFDDAPLPEDFHERKKAKPDLESLARVPPSLSGMPGTSLLSVGSGSGALRGRGFLFSPEGGKPLVFNLDALYQALKERIPALNIEGVAVTPDVVRLVHRGNSRNGRNAVIDLDPAVFFAAVKTGRVGPEALRSVRDVDLGTVPSPAGPVPLTFTDVTAAPDGGFLFTVAAERTDSTFDDGDVVASGVGRMDADGTVREMRLVESGVKIEGIDVATRPDGSHEVRLVSDPDNPERAAELFQVSDPGWLLTR